MRSVAAPILALLFALSPDAGRASECLYEDADFAAGLHRPTRWLLMPAHASTLGARSGPGSVAAEPTVLPWLFSEVHHALEEAGWSVDAESLAPSMLARDRGLTLLVESAWRRYSQIVPRACPIGDDAPTLEAGELTLGETALPLAVAAKTDGLVLVRARSIIRGKGLKALVATLRAVAPDAEWPTPTGDLTWVEIALVDGHDGHLLALSVEVVEGRVRQADRRLAAQAVKTAVDALPRPDEVSAWTQAPGADCQRPHVERHYTPELREHLRLLALLTLPPDTGEVHFHEVARDVPADVAALLASTPPPARARITLSRGLGSPGIMVRSQLDVTMRVSVNLARWILLEPGDEMRASIETERAWIFVTDEDGVELARAACPEAATRPIIADVLP